MRRRIGKGLTVLTSRASLRGIFSGGSSLAIGPFGRFLYAVNAVIAAAQKSKTRLPAVRLNMPRISPCMLPQRL